MRNEENRRTSGQADKRTSGHLVSRHAKAWSPRSLPRYKRGYDIAHPESGI